MGSGAERTHMAVAGPRLATKGADSLTTNTPCGPTFTCRYTERVGLRVAENGAGRVGGVHSTLQPHTRTQINRDEWRGAKQTA